MHVPSLFGSYDFNDEAGNGGDDDNDHIDDDDDDDKDDGDDCGDDDGGDGGHSYIYDEELVVMIRSGIVDVKRCGGRISLRLLVWCKKQW